MTEETTTPAVETSRFASRKFILAVVAVSSALGLIWFGKISDGVYSTIIVSTVAAYFTANVAQKKVTVV